MQSEVTKLDRERLKLLNRSKRLPDKRHQLYEECLLSLLSERPGIQSDEGTQLLSGQWCPDESGWARVQIVARMAHDLQTIHARNITQDAAMADGRSTSCPQGRIQPPAGPNQ